MPRGPRDTDGEQGRPPFVDAHHHLHDLRHPELRYPSLEPGGVSVVGETGAIRSPHYRAEDFIAETRFSGIVKSIAVECSRGDFDPVIETEWLQAEADRTGFPQAIVGRCHLAEPDAAASLERHLQCARLRGIRDPRANYLLEDRRWQDGLRRLGDQGLVLCLDTHLPRFDAVVAAAAAAPDTQISIDHCALMLRPGSPVPDQDYFAAWRAGLRQLAELENLSLKISGIGCNARDPNWTVASIRPWVLVCVEAFGAERTVVGSNWPIDRLFSSYPDVLDAYSEVLGNFTAQERESIFLRNAERIFHI